MDKIMNVAISLNQNVFMQAYVTLTSIYESNKDFCVHSYVLHGELEEEHLEAFQKLADQYGGKFTSCKIDVSLFEGVKVMGIWSVEAYFRLLLPEILPDTVERILYIDTDVIVRADISEYYFQDFGEKCFVVSPDLSMRVQLKQVCGNIRKELEKKGYPYFNSGVMLFSIKKLREISSFEDIQNAEKKIHDKIEFPDQDVLNYVFYDKVKYVDEYVYNFHASANARGGWNLAKTKDIAKIIHFAGRFKPWKTEGTHNEMDSIWWEYAKLTPYYHTLCEAFVESTIFDKNIINWVNELQGEIQSLQQKVKEHESDDR